MIETVSELFNNDAVYSSIPSHLLLRLMALLNRASAGGTMEKSSSYIFEEIIKAGHGDPTGWKAISKYSFLFFYNNQVPSFHRRYF